MIDDDHEPELDDDDPADVLEPDDDDDGSCADMLEFDGDSDIGVLDELRVALVESNVSEVETLRFGAGNGTVVGMCGACDEVRGLFVIFPDIVDVPP